MIPERANGSSKSKETKDTTEIKSNGCQSSIHRCTCIDMHASMRRVDTGQTSKIEAFPQITTHKDTIFQHYW